jgi:cell division protein FtsB
MKVRLLNILKKSGEWIRNHKYIFVTIVFLLIIMFIDENNMLSHMRNQETIKALTYEIQAMENDSAIVEAKNKLFTDGDTSVIEDAARERGLIRKNEDVFIVK